MSDLAIVLVLLVAAIVMFAINKPRLDAVALIMLVALPLNVSSPTELGGLPLFDLARAGWLRQLDHGPIAPGVPGLPSLVSGKYQHKPPRRIQRPNQA